MEFKLSKVAGRKTWHVVWYDGVATRRVSARTADRRKAEIFLADFSKGYGESSSTGEEISIRQIVSLYVEFKVKHEDADETFRKRVRTAWIALEPMFGALHPSELRPRMTKDFILSRKALGYAETTAARDIQALKAALSWAHSQELVLTGSVLNPPKVKRVTRDRFLDEAEIQRLLMGAEKAQPYLRLFVHLALKTAARHAAILQLKWDRVDFAQGVVDLKNPLLKGRRKGRATIPMGESLRDLLLEAKKHATTPYVIEVNGHPTPNVLKAVRKLGKKLGIPGLTPHVLRHTAATHMMRHGASIWDVAKFLAHSSVSTTEKVYAHHRPEYLKGASDILDKLG